MNAFAAVTREGDFHIDPLPPIGPTTTRRRPASRAAATIVSDLRLCLAQLNAAIQSGSHEDALAANLSFRAAVEDAPDDPVVLNGLGRSWIELARTGEREEATTALHEAQSAFKRAGAAGSKQGVPEAALLRYSLNEATVLWMLSDQTGDLSLADRCRTLSRSILTQMGAPKPTALFEADRARAYDNLGNALAVLGHGTEAIVAFQNAVHAWDQTAERVPLCRSLNNLGIALGAGGQNEAARASYCRALATISLDDAPLTWARIQSNLGHSWFEQSQATRAASEQVLLLQSAISAYRAAHFARQEIGPRSERIAATLNLASAMLSRGALLCASEEVLNPTEGMPLVSDAIALLKVALQGVARSDIADTLHNLRIALEVLEVLSKGRVVSTQITRHKRDIVNIIRGLSDPSLFSIIKTEHKYLFDGLTDFQPPAINITFMPQDNNLFTEIEAVFTKHGVPRSEWEKTSLELASRFKMASGQTSEAVPGTIFQDIPPSLLAKPYGKGGYTDEDLDNESLIKRARSIANAYKHGRSKGGQFTDEEITIARRANRLVVAHDRRRSGPGPR